MRDLINNEAVILNYNSQAENIFGLKKEKIILMRSINLLMMRIWPYLKTKYGYIIEGKEIHKKRSLRERYLYIICKLFDIDKLMKVMQAFERGEANGPG